MNKATLIISTLLITLSISSCELGKEEVREYVPEDKVLYDAIVSMDKTFFDAYNNCDLEKQALIYAEDIEFFHDKGGLMTSKTDIIDGTERNICGKVTRELVESSVEVYPISNYGAVEIGFHKFYNNQEPDAPSIPSKFIIMWKNNNDKWVITKVISLH